jgi:hypothetical protein
MGKTEVHPFQVQAQATNGESQQKQGVLEVRPRFSTWMMAVIPVLIMVCCVGGIVVTQAWEWLPGQNGQTPEVIEVTEEPVPGATEHRQMRTHAHRHTGSRRLLSR